MFDPLRPIASALALVALSVGLYTACSSPTAPTGCRTIDECIPPPVTAQQLRTQNVYVYVDTTDKGYIDAPVVLIAGGQTYVQQTSSVKATFTIPASITSVEIIVTVPGYVRYDRIFTGPPFANQGSHKQGIWVMLDPS